MASINSVQNQQVTYLSGVTSEGVIAAESFWSWDSNEPATYSAPSFQGKWGERTAGTPAQIGYAFDTASNWTTTEKAAFISAMDLWAAVANVTFTQVAEGTAVNSGLLFQRNSDESASGGADSLLLGTIGSTRLGQIQAASISIDASSDSFGPLGASLSTDGGHPWLTIIHELGHSLGLGHGGPYNVDDVEQGLYGIYDSLPWTLMSYNDEGGSGDGQAYAWGTVTQDGFVYQRVPTTWMPLDIVAIQRLYGVAANTPLSGGQTYGFNSNITGNIAKFFDFNINAKPIITLWNKGVGNTLDVSGFSQGSTINMADGTFSSVAGLVNNIAIAYGTSIGTVITGPGADIITANNSSNDVLGGAGADSISGGSGNDHLYGGGRAPVPGDGADTINAGAGSDYLQGNAGDDRLDGGDGSDRVQGGQGNDSIVGGVGNDSVNGNLGNDMIDGGADNDSLRGGQGSDSIVGGAGSDILLGDLGADTLAGGTGLDLLTGGGDGDVFNFATGEATFTSLTDIITDFADGADRIHMGFGVPSQVLYGAAFNDFASAAAGAQALLDGQVGFSDVAVLSVGGDSYIFYDPGPASALEAFKLAAFANSAAITAADFI